MRMQYGILRNTRETTATFISEPRRQRLAAFGQEAERIAGRCSSDLPLLLCDATQIRQALAEAIYRRQNGDQFLVAPLLGSLEFDQPQTSHIVSALGEIAELGDGLFVRSQTERMRVQRALQPEHLYVAVAPLIDQSVPETRAQLDSIYTVVWAPDEDALSLATLSLVLWNLKRPSIFVCRGQIPDTPHHFVGRDRAKDALAHAAVIIDTQISDPGTAIAFAGRGYGLATTITSGAHEYIQGVATYNMHDVASISSAITRAGQDRRAFTLPFIDASSSIRSTILAAQPGQGDHISHEVYL